MKNKILAVSVCLVLGGMVLSLTGSALAESGMSTDDMVRSLKAKKVRKLTRGLGRPVVDKDRIKSRGLVIEVSRKKVIDQTPEDREEIVKIVKKYELPTIDLTIYFDYNSAEITPTSIPTLVKLGQALIHNDLKAGTFLVGGHTDARGSGEYNLSLSQKRSIAVKHFLMESFNIEAVKLVAVGFGEEELKDADDPESGENRRVQVTNLSH